MKKFMAFLFAFTFLGALPIFAHHSIALQFDMTQEVEIEGTVVSMEWRNPHAWLQVEVTADNGDSEICRLSLVLQTLYIVAGGPKVIYLWALK